MKKTEQIILVGGGGHCKSVIEVIESRKQFEIAGIVDIAEKIGETICGYPIVASDNDLPQLVKKYKNFHLTIGQIKSAKTRIKLYTFLKNIGGNFPAIIAKSAIVSKYSQIGEGAVLMHNTLVNADAKIGNNTIINTGALIEHDVQIGHFCHISTKAIVNGNCTVGNECFIGSNSVLSNGIEITNNTLVAAGSAVHKSIKLSGTYLGFPLRKIK